MTYKDGHIIGFFNSLEKNLPAENVIPMNGIAIQYTNTLQKKPDQKLVILLVSVTII